MDQEEVEIYASHQLQNSFLSTIDHLPCDVVRSLWLIQSCNIKIDKLKQELNNLLQKYQATESLPQEEIVRIYELKQSIRHLFNETIQEGKTLNNQMIIHKLHLEDEINQLQTIKEKQVIKVDVEESQEQLRKQLRQHYKDQPLISQVEAVEQQRHSQKEQKRTSAKSGIKLVLRIPKQDKVSKPKGKHVVKKSSTQLKSKPINATVAKKANAFTKKEKKRIRKEEILLQVDQAEEEEDNKRYCFCQQPSLGDMIACDNETSCPNGEWFHYKCVGLLNRVDALKFTTGKIPWYCSDGCRKVGEAEKARQQEMKKRKRRRKW